MKRPDMIQPEKFKSALDARRDIQKEDSLIFVDEKKEQLMTLESWYLTLSK
jgi:hypothetical protein